jgi:hypothetical protein
VLYAKRILWRAGQHKLLSKGCYEFDQFGEDIKTSVVDRVSFDGIPVLLFWAHENLWTLITSREIIGVIGSDINRMSLNKIGRQIQIFSTSDADQDEIKRESEYLLLGVSRNKFWTPKGAPVFAVIGILRMFPLRHCL